MMVDLCAYKLLSEGGLYHDSAPLMRIYIMYRDILRPGRSTYKKATVNATLALIAIINVRNINIV